MHISENIYIILKMLILSIIVTGCTQFQYRDYQLKKYMAKGHVLIGTQKGVEQVIKVTSVNFAADDDTFNLNWPGPPRRPWVEADKEYYTVTINLSAPAPEAFKFAYYVKENRRWWFDPSLGYLSASVALGASTAQGKFWLVCTKKGKVKGNLGKGDDSHAVVYLEDSGLSYERELDNWYYRYEAIRKEHTVRCK